MQTLIGAECEAQKVNIGNKKSARGRLLIISSRQCELMKYMYMPSNQTATQDKPIIFQWIWIDHQFADLPCECVVIVKPTHTSSLANEIFVIFDCVVR